MGRGGAEQDVRAKILINKQRGLPKVPQNRITRDNDINIDGQFLVEVILVILAYICMDVSMDVSSELRRS